jgi:CRP-like cAMP-binding protein
MSSSKHAPATKPAALIEWTDVQVQRVEYAVQNNDLCSGRSGDQRHVRRAGAPCAYRYCHTPEKKAVIAVLEPGHFLGEGCLVGQTHRMATASAMSACTIVVVERAEMVRQLHGRPAFADLFLRHMLTRNIRIEEDLIDQLFNSSEKRLARTLLLLARYGEPEASHRTLPRVSQETLAEMVGTTRSRVNFFLNKFRKLGFIEYNGGLKINNSLLSVVLRD